MSSVNARATLAVVLVSSAFAVTLGSAADANPTAGRGSAGCATTVLAKAQPAGAVATSNPSAFRQAAARNQRSEAKFKETAKDNTLWLDTCGQAFYVEEKGQTSTTAATAAPPTTVPLADTFTLESKPGSNRTIYLDFNGETVTGTAWNNSYGTTITAEPYSIDSTVSTAFSDAELTEIQKAWQVVAEDYAPFDVNVTTKDPGTAAIDRSSSTDLVYGSHAVITNGGVIYNDCGCGGVAYVNVFNASGSQHMFYQPAWVFSNGTGKSGKNMGEATAHEVGHNFGLDHDGTSTSGYYWGSAPWAPIMGASYNQPVTQWSAGEYATATTQQNDISVIASGAPLRTDDHGNTSAVATAVTTGTPVNGIIATRTDVDAFSFTGEGETTVTVSGASGLPNLDVQLTVLDGSDATVAVVNPAVAYVSSSVASGLDVTWSGSLPAGGATYSLLVDGIGSGDPLTAGKYSDYGSLGNFQISVTGTGTQPPLSASVVAPPAAKVGTAYSATPVTASGGTTPYGFSATGLPGGLSINALTGAIAGTPSAAGRFTPSVTVTDAASASVIKSFTLTVNPASTPLSPSLSQPPAATVGTAYSATPVTATGGTTPYTWSATGLPGGLAINASTGTISGTPTTAGSFAPVVTVTDAASASAWMSFNLTVNPAPAAPLAWVTAAALPLGKVGSSYATQIRVTGAAAPYTWALTSGSLPAGLTWSASGQTATVSGTPTDSVKASFTLRVTSGSTSITRKFTLQVKR
jgi:hypothetical protein